MATAKSSGPKAPTASKAAPAKAAAKKTTAADAAAGEAPPLLLAHSWEGDVDLTGWWMSEKLDGVRAYWDGSRFLSRLGNAYKAPAWFTRGLPKTPLDGELWVDRKKFQRCVSIVRRQDENDDWREVSYVVFDAPALRQPFEERIQYLRQFLSETRPDKARFLEQVLCRGTAHMKEELARVESLGGEGVMMRRPGSHYEVGRSYTLLKVKSFYDSEAIVIGHQPGTGKHKGRLGALLVEMPDGTRFAVGTGLTDAERTNPPAPGQIITYRYQELSDGGVPRFPSYVGVRHDIRWPPPAKK